MRRNKSLATQQLLTRRAQLMRAHPSWPEQVLWRALRSGQLGVPFRRQVVVGRFVVDFLAPRARLVVEVDGPQHRLRRAADARRDRKLVRLGYRVLRLEAEVVVTRLPVALACVREALGPPLRTPSGTTSIDPTPRSGVAPRTRFTTAPRLPATVRASSREDASLLVPSPPSTRRRKCADGAV